MDLFVDGRKVASVDTQEQFEDFMYGGPATVDLGPEMAAWWKRRYVDEGSDSKWFMDMFGQGVIRVWDKYALWPARDLTELQGFPVAVWCRDGKELP